MRSNRSTETDLALTPFEISKYYRVRAAKIKQGRKEWRGPCPIHQGTRDSFAIQAETGLWHCHSTCGRGGDVYKFEMALSGNDFAAAVKEVHCIIGRAAAVNGNGNGSKPHIVEEYPYVDEQGNLLFQVVRFEPKDFKQRRPDGRGGFIWGLDGVRRVLFHLDRLAHADTVLIVEGEKDVLAAEALGFTATCNPMGAGKWRDEYSVSLVGKNVVVLPDNDERGGAHAQTIAASVHTGAKTLKVVTVAVGKDLSDWIAAGATKDTITAAISAAPAWRPGAGTTDIDIDQCSLEAEQRLYRQRPTPPGDLPRICAGGRQLRDTGADSLHALQLANNPPFLFGRAGDMVSIGPNEKGQAVILKVDVDSLRGHLSRAADYFKVGKKDESGKVNEYDCSPPLDAVRYVRRLAPGQWGFPALDAITDSPILRPDFSILETPGYDATTLLFYAPDPALHIPSVPECPSSDQVKIAMSLIDRVIGDFPFENAASRANMIAAILTPIIRPAIEAPVPMALFDAPQAGSGKSLLCDVVSIIATGGAGRMFSAPKDEDEWRKVITTALLTGGATVIYDNITRTLENGDLCSVLTATTWADRAMKTHDAIMLPVRTSFMASGNNIRLGGDMPRRCYRIRLDPKCSQPYLRTGPTEGQTFAIPDLKAWTLEHRGELLAAILTLARAWYASGKPKSKVKVLGSFEIWTKTVGGILEHSGVPGFMANAGEMYADADEESTQWEAFLATLEEIFPEPFTSASVADELQGTTWDEVRRISEPSKRALQLKSALPEKLLEVVDKDGLFRRRVGKMLAERVDRRYGKGNIHIKRSAILHGSQQWAVARR